MHPENYTMGRHGIPLGTTPSTPVSKMELIDERKRPLGVSILAVLNTIGAVILVLAAIGGGSELGDPGAAAAYGAIMGLFGVFSLMVAIGLWRLRNWARIAAIILYSLSALIGVIELSQGASPGFMQLLVAGNIAAYLCRARARDAFNGSTN